MNMLVGAWGTLRGATISIDFSAFFSCCSFLQERVTTRKSMTACILGSLLSAPASTGSQSRVVLADHALHGGNTLGRLYFWHSEQEKDNLCEINAYKIK
jgi:hypothetical protein